MRTHFNLPGAAIGLALLLTASPAFAQGNLTPPGAPEPTMLSLSQVQPRTPISSAPFTITQPGSYYLTTNVSVSSGNAITINTNGVTLDLNGFTIFSTAPGASGYGILINNNLRNITIANGFIQGSVTNNGNGVYSGNGFSYGIAYPSSAPVNVLVSRISVSGCLNYGIDLNLGDSMVVESCTVRTVGSYGIFASTIKQSSAIDCGSTAIFGDQVSDCRGQSSGGGTAVFASYTALNCYGVCNSGAGLIVNIAQNCYGSCNTGDGVYAYYTAANCYGYNNGSGYGLYCSYTASGCYGYCYSGTGLNAFIANVCHGASSTGTPLLTSHNVNSF